MDITVERDEFNKALKAVGKVVIPSHTIPILQHIKVVPDMKSLVLSSSNLDQWATAKIELTQASADDGCCVPFKKLSGFVDLLPSGGQVRLKMDGGRIVVSSGRSRITLQTLPVADFPSPRQIEGESVQAVMPCADLKALIEGAAHAVASLRLVVESYQRSAA